MKEPDITAEVIRFGIFEANPRARELRKKGVRIRLQDQPFQILLMLLEHAGEVVTREEIQRHLWPEGTFVEFEHSIGTAIKKLRQTLGDDADTPRYVETLPRRGYRFIGPVTNGNGTAGAITASLRAAPPTSALRVNTTPPVSSRRVLPWAITAGGLTIAVVVGFGLKRSTQPVEQPLIRLDVDLGADIALPAPAADGSSVIISPDGARLVYVASVSGRKPKLFTRRLDQPNATELPGTEDASGPFFSPDGQWVGFFANNKLNKISMNAGAVVPLVDVTVFAGASWSEDGSIIVGRAIEGGMLRIPSSGGVPSTLTELATGEVFHGGPQVLPGGKAVLFVAGTLADPDDDSIEVVSLADRRKKILLRGGQSPWYAPSGHLVYVHRGAMFAIPFDPERSETHGTAVPVLDQVAYSALTHSAQFYFSGTGTLVYRRASGSSGMATLQWLNRAGNKEPLLARPGTYKEPRLSPDGKRLALVVKEGGRQDIWVYEWQRDTMTRLTLDGGPNADPIWSPDGRYVVFDSYKGGMLWTRSDGAGQPQQLTESKSFQIPASFSPGGGRLVYHEFTSSNRQVWTVSVENDGDRLRAGKAEQFLKSQFSQDFAALSPDGRWLAYTGDESGREEVYVRAFGAAASGQGGKWQISNGGGEDAVWSRNGHELLYFSGDQIMTASYSVKRNTFLAGKPRPWAAKARVGQNAVCDSCFDLSPDGKRMAVLTPVETPELGKADHEMVLLFNFFGELRRRAPREK